jgi:hypothetical protein
MSDLVTDSDPDTCDLTSDLIIDFDFIVEWVCGVDFTQRLRAEPC